MDKWSLGEARQTATPFALVDQLEGSRKGRTRYFFDHQDLAVAYVKSNIPQRAYSLDRDTGEWIEINPISNRPTLDYGNRIEILAKAMNRQRAVVRGMLYLQLFTIVLLGIFIGILLAR